MLAKEKIVRVPVGGGKSVKGYLRGSLTKPLVIFVHGLTGDPNEHQFYNGARYLEKHGFSTFRYYAYDSRPLVKATLKTHAADFDKVVAYFRKRTKRKIFAIGHSYGGATILMAKDKDLDGAVLWDPTHTPSFVRKLTTYAPSLRAYRLHWHVDYLLGKPMVKEAGGIDWDTLGGDVKFPLKVVIAGDGVLRKSRKYAENAQGKRAVEIVPGAGHNFNEDGTAEKLFSATTKWLKGIK